MLKRSVLLAACVLLSSWPVAAQPMGPHFMGMADRFGALMLGKGSGMMLPLVLRHAHLKPEQNDQVRKIMDANHETLRALFNQLQAANDQLAGKLFAPGTVQAADLEPDVQHITQLRQQLMAQGLKTALAIRAVLTPEQLAQVATVKAQMQKLQSDMRQLLEGDN